MIFIELPPKISKRELFPQLLERVNRRGFNINGRQYKFVRVFKTNPSGKKLWIGEACPICKRNKTAFRLCSLENPNIQMKACLACKKVAVLGM